ncbi:tandem-95 repeat protein [Emcibacter sp.]|uniref:tandem-95 repeat protein n=1 Tax=Emcibacter sp. TaxID=1979954 RepID=UPI002AA65C8F|nr:tandem-95 repeat protein [Emcibacter sp.]
MSTGESGSNGSDNFDIELDPVLQGADQVKKTERPQVTMGEESDESTQDTQTRSNIHMGSDQSEGSAFPDGQYDGSEPVTGTEQGAVSGDTATTDAEQSSLQTTASSDFTTESFNEEGGRQEPVFSSGSSFSALELDQAETGQEGAAPLGTQGTSGENTPASSALQEESAIVNGAPVAADDSFDTGEDSTYSIDVLANDVDPDADPLFITGAELQDGAGAVTHDGQKIIFNPGSAYDHLAEGDSETVTISYTVADPSGATDTAYVTLTVNGQNDAPVDISIAGNSLTENAEGAVVGTLSTTDVDTNDVHSYSVSDDRFEVVDGVLKLKGDVSLDHEVEPTVSVTVTATDRSGAEVSKSFDFNVADINEAPENTGGDGNSEIDDNIAINDGAEDPDNSSPVVEAVDLGEIDEDTSITFSAEDLLANASDIDGDVLAVTEVMVDEAYGAIVDNADGTWTFTPVENFNGSDVPLTFEATDGIETVSSTASLDVIAVNDGPVAIESDLTTGENVVLLDQLHATDIEGDDLSYSLVSAPEAGTVVVNADGSYSFDPGSDFDGLKDGEEQLVSFDFEVSDGQGGSDVATMQVRVIGSNDGPVVNAVELGATDEDTSITFSAEDLLAKASDIDGDVLAVTEVMVDEAYGAIVDNADGTWTFTPVENFNGSDVPLTFEATDGIETVSSTASLDVIAVNDGPVAIESDLTTGENVVLLDQLHATDIEGDDLSYSLVSAPEAGTVVVNADGSYSFDPGSDFDGLKDGEEQLVSFDFEVSDGQGGSDVATMQVRVIGSNDGPVVNAVELGATDEDTSITFSAEDLLANASDIDGDVLAVTEVNVDESYGAVVDNGDGTWTFTPVENFNGADVPLTFEVTDGIETVSSTASLDVIAVNDGPVVDLDAAPAFSTAEDAAITIQPADLLGNASDIDGDALSVTNLRIGNEVSEIPVTLKISGDHYDPDNVQDVGVGSPDFEVYVNGELIEVNGETRFEVSAERGDWEYFSFELPAGTEIDSVDVRFVNDAWEGTGDRDGDGVAGEDRNLIVDKINVGGTQDGNGDFIGGVTIEAEDASYARSSDVIDGRETMAWSGSLQFDMSDVPVADYSTLVPNEDGSWTFQPGADFNGDLTLTYDVVDGNGGVVKASATLTVTPENDAPVITTSLDGNAPVSLDTNNVVLSGDGTSGQLGDNVTIEGFATDGSAAVLKTSGDGVGIQGERIDTQIDYDPATGTSEQLVLTFDNPVTEVGLVTDRQIENEFPGGEQGKWTAYDANGNEVATGSLTPETGTRLSGSSFSYDLETGDVPVAKIVIEATDATGQSSGDNSEFTVKSVSYTEVPEMLSDGVQLSTSVAEGATDGTEAAAISATDVDGDALTYAITSGNDDGAFVIDPQSGEVTVADGSLLDHETESSRTLTVEVADGNGGTDSVELVVNIDDVNEGPVAVADSFSGTEDQAVSGNVLINDTDVDGDSLSVVADTIVTANGGTVELAADGSFTYTPAENFHGEDSFSYTMSDGSQTDSASATLTVAPDNDGPVVGSVDLGATAEDNSITFSAGDLLANASDVDGDLLSVSSVDVDPAFGSVTDNGDGTWTFSPTDNFSGDDVQVSFDVTDGTETVTSTASLDVTAVADAPEMHLSGSLTLDPAHGNYDLPADGILTIDVSYLSVNAGYNNSHGYYIADADGNPLGGAVIQDNVKDGDAKTITLDTSDYEGGVSLGFFIIPNGDNKNAGLEDGTEVTFENIDGVWTPMADGQPLSGQNSPAYFSNQDINPDGYDHFSDSASEGNQNWEDLWGGGDGDYTDVNTQVDVALAPHEQQAVIAEVNTAADLLQIKTVVGDQDGSESLSVSISAIPEGAILSDGVNSFEATAGNTSTDISGWNLDGLTITATDGSDDFALEVTTTSTEGSNGDTASTTQSINVEIADQVIEGTAGAQDLQGAGGDDTLVYNADNTWSGYAAHNVETGENVSLSGYNRSSDVFDGGSGHDVLQGTSGDDALFLDDGISSFESGSQARIQNVEEINMGAGDDILDMTSSKYTYDQGVAADGGDGNDVLWTSTGDDTLTGGAGNDAMFGGDGNDMFIFGSNDGTDSVSGGAGWTDAIELNGFTGSASEQGWTLTLENGDSIQSVDDANGEMLLTDDAAGTIVFDDGGQITFDGIEKIVW